MALSSPSLLAQECPLHWPSAPKRVGQAGARGLAHRALWPPVLA